MLLIMINLLVTVLDNGDKVCYSNYCSDVNDVQNNNRILSLTVPKKKEKKKEMERTLREFISSGKMCCEVKVKPECEEDDIIKGVNVMWIPSNS